MGDTAFDTTPLSARASGPRWRRFRAEAVEGLHGADLAESRWWGRHPDWRHRVRRRFRFHEFAEVNGLRYLPEPGLGRLGAHIFVSPTEARHLDRIEVPGPRGFAIANYESTPSSEGSDTDGFRAGYVVFRLRETYPHTLVSRHGRSKPRPLRDVGPVAGPAGMQVWSTKPENPLLQRLLTTGVVDRARELRAEIEIVGDQFFLLNGRIVRVSSARTWRRLEVIAHALAPFLATPSPSPSQSVNRLPLGPVMP